MSDTKKSRLYIISGMNMHKMWFKHALLCMCFSTREMNQSFLTKWLGVKNDHWPPQIMLIIWYWKRSNHTLVIIEIYWSRREGLLLKSADIRLQNTQINLMVTYSTSSMYSYKKAATLCSFPYSCVCFLEIPNGEILTDDVTTHQVTGPGTKESPMS